jgi:hypothetical protein
LSLGTACAALIAMSAAAATATPKRWLGFVMVPRRLHQADVSGLTGC